MYLTGTRPEDLEKAGLQPGNYFTYFDERHTTGTDIKQPFNAINLMSVSKTSLQRNMLQSIMRLRQFFAHQDVELIVPEKVSTSIDKHSLTDFIFLCLKNETIQQAKNTYRSLKQMIDNVFYQMATKTLLYSWDSSNKKTLHII